jgi:DNA-binding CsgD family transcriptional regulator
MVDTAWGAISLEDIARRDWHTFLHIMDSSFSIQGAPSELAYWRESFAKDDCLRMMQVARNSSIRGLVPLVTVPTLILNARRRTEEAPVGKLAEDGQTMASLIPNARLVLYDVFGSIVYSSGPEPPRAVPIIEEFLEEFAPVAAPTRSDGLDEAQPSHSLSRREMEVLCLIAQGKSNREIADELFLSVRTVERHINHIYDKIGAHTKAQATAYALRHNFS